MLLLDLDLDLFVDPIAYGKTGAERLSDVEYTPWPERRFRQFLETQCGLRPAKLRGRRPLGKVFSEHCEAFFWWRELIEEGTLTAPFDLVHVDAHADLGVGERGLEAHRFISTALLFWPLRTRRFPESLEEAHFGSANYLAFATACRWLASITYVTHPKWQPNRDLYPFLFRDHRVESGWIELKGCHCDDFETMAAAEPSFKPVRTEPGVKFGIVPGSELRLTRLPDLVCLSVSPGYTPASADRLIEVFREYVDGIR